MKKKYIAPCMEIEIVDMKSALLAASNSPEMKIWDDEDADDSDAMGKKHGKTFSLWDMDED